LPNEDEDYLGKLIKAINNICAYSVKNKVKIAKVITTSLLSVYSINSLYNSGITFKKNPHYSFFLPSESYIKNVLKKVKKNYKVKTSILAEDKIFERNITSGNNNNPNVLEMYVVNNFINFENFLSNKINKESLYKFSKYKEFEKVENIFNYVQVLKHEKEIIMFQGKLKKHFWIHLPLKWNFTKTENGTTYTLTFTPLYKYYSNHTIEIKIQKENNNIKFVTCVKSREKNTKTNTYFKDVLKSIAIYLTYNIFEGINNNIDILHKRNFSIRPIHFIRSRNFLKKKNNNSYLKHVFSVFKPQNFKMKRT
ncbi:selenoprotein, putative (Sel3), partial [Plasmodium ovale curtisi]